MFEVIQEIKPTWVVGENVYGIVNWDGGMVFDQVQSDLEAEGYEVQAVIIPACAVNAPHRRDRVWFVAKSCDKRCNDRSDNREERYIQKNKRTAEKDQSEREGRECGAGEISSTSSDTKPEGREGSIGVKGSIRFEPGAWDNWPTVEPTIRRGDDGIPSGLVGITFPKWRNESIKALGNSIVPQVVLEIFKVIEEYENQPKNT